MNPKSLANLAPPFKPGQSGNPGGKPAGARNTLNTAFLNALLAEFDVSGPKAIKECAEKDPSGFVRVLAAILPKEMEISRPLDDVTDEQLDAAAIAIRTILAAQDSGANKDAKKGGKQAKGLPALP